MLKDVIMSPFYHTFHLVPLRLILAICLTIYLINKTISLI